MGAALSRWASFLQLDLAERRAILEHKASRFARGVARRVSDSHRSTYALSRSAAGPLSRHLAAADLALLRSFKESIRAVSAHYLEHRFDLLGSGWLKVVRSDAGEVNAANRAESRRLSGLLAPGYEAIDWQLDFKSGFRWSESTPCDRIAFGMRGVDIKVPWELGRLQHLPQLAHAYRLAREGEPGFEVPSCYVAEFRNQVLDFVSGNPPRYGVNWASSMDVALRAASLLASRDLFLSAGASLDEEFERIFARSIYEHGTHIAANLDWHPRYRANHYLCGIAGLLFVAAYLPPEDETARWRRICIEALRTEAERQFLPDGGNFEASTGYHRLSGEALAYASALVAGELPEEHFARLARIGRFAAETARPDGLAPQIGDQDSGRFLKLSSRWVREDGRWVEELRDHRGLVAAVAGLLGLPPEASWPNEWKLEHACAQSLAGNRAPTVKATSSARQHGKALDEPLRRRLSALPSRHYELPFGTGTCTAVAFPSFGLFVLRRGGRSYACIRCGPIGLNGLGAHAHNDALSLELVAEGRDLLRDPGSYVYTPFPDERDRYRSVCAHFAPRIAGREPATLGPGLFRLGDEAQARCLYFGADGFLGTHVGYGAPVYRLITVTDTMLLIDDFSEGGELEPLPAAGTDPLPYSPRYGVREG